MTTLITWLGGRKFVLSIGCGLVNGVLLWFGKLDSQAYELIILGTVGAFIAGNVAAGRPQRPERKDGDQ